MNKKYGLIWWYQNGRYAKQHTYKCKSYAKSIIADLAYKFGYWAA